jgi:hypothetical protein
LLFQKVSERNKTIDVIRFVDLMKQLHATVEAEGDLVSFVGALEKT